MNIGLITSDLELVNKFKLVEYFNQVYMGDNDSLIFSDVDIILLSDKLVDFNTVLELRKNKYKEIKHLFYMVTEENYNVNIQSILEIENIKMIQPKLTKTQIVECICSDVLGVRQNKNIITFFGADNKVGTTQTAQGLAELIANNTDSSVFLAFLNGKASTQYLDSRGPNYGLDSIKVKLLNNIISINELTDVCIKKDKLTILPGAHTMINNRHFHPRHIEYLVQLVSNKFDVVIIDAGSNIEVGMTIGALNATNIRYLITTQQESALDNFLAVYQQVLSSKLNIKDFMLIVNKYIKDPGLLDSFSLADKYKLTLAAELPYLNWGWQSEKEKKTLVNYEDLVYKNQMNKLAKVICNQLSIQYIEKDLVKVPWYKRALL